MAGHFGVVLFYRGSWCPYRNAQLRFPVGHSADAAAIAEATGAFVNSGPRYLREHAPASQSR
jgi:hypothetical protein